MEYTLEPNLHDQHCYIERLIATYTSNCTRIIE